MSNTVRYYGDRILRNRIKNLGEHNQRKINKSIKKFKHRYLPGGLITFTPGQRRKFATKAKAREAFTTITAPTALTMASHSSKQF